MFKTDHLFFMEVAISLTVNSSRAELQNLFKLFKVLFPLESFLCPVQQPL